MRFKMLLKQITAVKKISIKINKYSFIDFQSIKRVIVYF